ncbi:MAG: type II toxin-antitoxin system VapC family toxin [SAR324 cluster bacterium]|nr:type II toxin-antitoxin system VapC family toxin [SAR324 cluster bacterium]
MSYLFDSNILIYYFNGSMTESIKNRVSGMMQEGFNISVISKMEFLGFRGFIADEVETARAFLEYAKIIPMDDNIVNEVIHMRQRKAIKLPDAIIASTSIHSRLSLVTRNSRDFSSLGLTIINPFESL